MTSPPDPDLQTARHRMVDDLLQRSVLHPAWQAAFHAVRREDLHLSLRSPKQHQQPATTGHRLADTIYDPDAAIPMSARAIPGAVVAPAPAFVARLLSAMRLTDGDTVMVVGATDGYLPALLCERLGAAAVTVTDSSGTVLEAAGTALRDAGYQPTMCHRAAEHIDLLHTTPTRVICAQPRERIPMAWIRCVAPGGVIVAALSLQEHGGPVVALDVTADRAAEGRFLPGDAPALPAGPHLGQPAEQIGLTVTGARLGVNHGIHRLWWRTPDALIVQY